MSGKNAWPASNNPLHSEPGAAPRPRSASLDGPVAWFCFAVQEEAAFLSPNPQRILLITGMGRRNAERTVQSALHHATPKMLLTCGFAGGLNPVLPVGTVLCSSEESFPWKNQLIQAGARPARFHPSDRILVRPQEKRGLYDATGDDAVEMESAFLCQLCRARGIPCAVVRVISDAADEELPLDFNRLLTVDWRLDYGKLAWAVARRPAALSGLLRLRRQTRLAAFRLAGVLETFSQRIL